MTTFLNSGNQANNKTYSIFNNLTNRIDESNQIVIGEFQKLTQHECSNLYRNSNLARKIINLYPEKAFNIGYQIKLKSDGQIVEQNDEILLEAFREASIYSRLYGHCFLYLELSDGKRLESIKSFDLQITGYKLFYQMYEKIDFWEKENFFYHKDRVLLWKGVDSRLPLDFPKIDDVMHKYDSIFDSLVTAIYDNFITKSYAKYILENLSYLLIGQSGLAAKVSQAKVTGKDTVGERMTQINLERNLSRIFSYDLNNEDVKFISQTIAGVKDLIQEFKENVAVESEYPYDKLFEVNAGSSSLGSGVQNQLVARFLWAETKHEWTKSNWLPHYIKLFKKLRDYKKIKVEIPFIFSMTELEKAELENLGADRVKKLIESGVITPNEARTGYQGNEYKLNIKLDTNEKIEVNENESLETNQDAFELINILSNKDWEEIAKISFADIEKLADQTIEVANG